MTDLVRPIAGNPFSDSDGAGTASTELIDAAFDLIETNEDALALRTSPNIITTSGYSDIAELLLNGAEATTGWHTVNAVILGTGSINSGSTSLTSTTPLFTSDAVGRSIRVAAAGPLAGTPPVPTTLATTVAAFVNSTTVTLAAAASTTATGTQWDHDSTGSASTVTNTLHTQGTLAMGATLKGPNNDLTTKFYVNLTEAGYAGGFTVSPGESILVDVYSPFTNNPNLYSVFAVTIADGVDLTGNAVSKVYAQADAAVFTTGNWYTFSVPVGTLTTIRSIGIKKVVNSGNSTNRSTFLLDNIRRASVTPLDQAYGLPNVTAVMPASYTTGAVQQPVVASPTKSILDLRPTKIHGGVRWVDDYQIDTTGGTDLTGELQTLMDSLSPGDTLVGSPEHLYLMNGTLDYNVPGVTFDWNGAKMFQNQRGTERMNVLRAQGVTLKNGMIFGYTEGGVNTGSTMTTFAGAPTNSGNTKVLATTADEVRIPLISGTSLSNSYSRDTNFQNRFDFTLHDTAPTTGDCVVTIYEPLRNTVRQTTTLTLTGTPTLRSIYYTPRFLTERLIVTVRKASGSGNVIVTDWKHFGFASFNTIYEENYGIAASLGGDDCLVENFLIEGVSGDGIGVNSQETDTGAQRLTVRNVLIRNTGRDGLTISGGRGHRYFNVSVMLGSRHAIDLEPEGSPNAVDDVLLENFRVYGSQLLAINGGGGVRVHNIKINGAEFYMNTGVGAIGGAYNGAQFSNITITRSDSSQVDDHFPESMQGCNIVLENWKTDEGIQINDLPAGQTDEYGTTVLSGGITLRNIHFTKHPHLGYIEVNCAGVHLENITADSTGATLDTTSSLSGIGLAPDTTYTNVNLALHRAALPNSWKGIATGKTWFPAGLDLRNESLSRVRSLSGGTTKGNNLGQLAQNVSAAQGTATVVFPAKTYQNITLFTLAATTGGTLTPNATYYYRVAGRPRRGGPLVALAEKSVPMGATGTATMISASATYSVGSGFYVDGLTIYRSAPNTPGVYNTRFDIVPTADLNGWGNMGTGQLIVPVKDLGTTVDKGTPTVNFFFHGYSFPYSTSAGALVPADETGFEPDTLYAVFLEPSWQTTWKITAKRTNGFDIEFGIPVPTGGGTFSWMIARF